MFRGVSGGASALLRAAVRSSGSGGGGRTFRSAEWFAKKDRDGFIHRSWMKNQGLPHDLFQGRPVIGICNTWSELAPCNAHFRRIAEYVKRGVWESGGFPLEFNVMSLGETLMRPTTMIYRNLLSMEVEECLRANPVDGVVLLAGCDKTTPGTLMGAASVDLPTLLVSGGPMLNGNFCGCTIGSGTSVWKMSEDVRAGAMTNEAFMDAEAAMSRSNGHCNTMGTASTMACMAESLGIALPTNAAIPAVDSRRFVLAHMAGRRIVQMTRDDVTMSKIVTRASFENAIATNAAIGGSTNFVVHLLALAGRMQMPLELRDIDKHSAAIPLLANLMPSGQHLMEQFYYAGGLPVVHRALLEQGILHGDAATVSGRPIGENVKDAVNYNTDVIGTFAKPVLPESGIAVLFGNLAPRGCVLKLSAASPALLRHRGRALVFDSREDMYSRLADPALDVDASSVLVLRNQGPTGYPGMPETGNLPIPLKLLQQGVTDMVRITDARMSGTAYGTVLLHVAPEGALRSPLAVVRTGDTIELDVSARTLHLDVSDAELESRLAAWREPPPPRDDRGYISMHRRSVLQADRGCDLDFLVGRSGSYVPAENH